MVLEVHLPVQCRQMEQVPTHILNAVKSAAGDEPIKYLDPAWYVDPLIFDLERDVVGSTWHVAAHKSQLIEQGAYVAGVAGNHPYLIVRDHTGRLRGFDNRCLHNQAVVMIGEGRASELECPLHGWRYSLDGRLIDSPDLDRRVAESDTCVMTRLSVQQRGEWVFVKAMANASSSATLTRTQTVPRVLDDISVMRFPTATHTATLRVNWKWVIDEVYSAISTPGICWTPHWFNDMGDFERAETRVRLLFPCTVVVPEESWMVRVLPKSAGLTEVRLDLLQGGEEELVRTADRLGLLAGPDHQFPLEKSRPQRPLTRTAGELFGLLGTFLHEMLEIPA